MRKRVLRYGLGFSYVLLLTLLLLYQAGAFGEGRNWGVATLTTLFLGVALAVVLTLYMRVNEQIRKEGGGSWRRKEAGFEKPGQRHETRAEDKGRSVEKKETDRSEQRGTEEKTTRRNAADARNYEEIYADFLHVCEGRGLSERELEVAWLLFRGHTNRQIGEELFIAETTVKKHVTHIYQKLEVYSRKDFRAMVQNRASSSTRLGEKE